MKSSSTMFIRRQRGTTLVEVVVSSALLVGMMVIAFPAFKSVGDAGDEGANRITAQAENQAGLLKLASELQNTSTSEEDEFGVMRLRIVDGEAPVPMTDWRDNGFGGFTGQLGLIKPSEYGKTSNDSYDATAGTTQTTSTTKSGPAGTGSGQRGGTYIGRVREETMVGAETFNDGAAVRPRQMDIPLNSELTFQKVVGYDVGATGEPEIEWSTDITYRVENRRLVRIQDGVTRTAAPMVIAFRAAITDTGTVSITLVTQKRTATTGKLSYQANTIEVQPKN